VLPPTIGVEAPNPKVDWESLPLHINTATRPWLRGGSEHPRRAGVSAFGFGGTNFHAVLEEYDRELLEAPAAPVREWPAELLVWRAVDKAHLDADLARLQQALDRGARPILRDLAHTLAGSTESRNGPVLAIVAADLSDLKEKLTRARQAIAAGQARLEDPRGIFFAERPEWTGARVAFVFPGQGSQYRGMLADLTVAFPEVRAAFDQFDRVLRTRGRRPVGPLVFPQPAFRDDQREAQRAVLAAPDVAQPAVGASSVGLLRLLGALGLEPDVVAGHSYGELVALHAAGSLTADALAELSEARGRILMEAAGPEPGVMAALSAGPAQVQAVLSGIEGVWAVNWNGPSQTVISGTRAAVECAARHAKELGVRAQVLPVACAFHSPLVATARRPLTDLVAAMNPGSLRLPVYANATATAYPSNSTAIPGLLGEHLAQPVRFAEMIEAMHADGARVFVEVGPGGIVSALLGSILAGKPHLAVACDHPGRPSIPSLLNAIARLVVAGLPLKLERLTQGRSARRLDLARLEAETAEKPLPPSTWLVNGARARPARGPDTPLFGQGPALPVPKPTLASQPPTIVNGSPVFGRPPAVPILSGPGSERVLAAFQKTMQTFLDVQEQSMRAYLAARGSQVPAAGPAVGTTRLGATCGLPTSTKVAVAEDAQRAEFGSLVAGQAAGAKAPETPETPGESHLKLNEVAGRNGHAPEASPAHSLERDHVASRLLQIVQERTGYPAEMLKLDLDLEADLGIDSIKRVEILGSLRDALPGLAQALGSDTEAMDLLSRARTLGAIVDRLGKSLERAIEPRHVTLNRNGTGAGVSKVSAGQESAVSRYVLERIEAPLPAGVARLAPGGQLLITDDERGIARAVAADLRALGHPVVVVRHGAGGGEVEGVNLTSPASVSALIERLRERGPIAGIVHALAMRARPPAGLDPESWAARMAAEVRGLFLLARASAEDLARSAARGGACLIAATGMGGSFASAGAVPADIFPGHGGIAGLLKTLAIEWADVRSRVVDLDPSGAVEVLAAHLVHEVLTHDARAEVGYHEGRRVALRHVLAPLPGDRSEGSSLEVAPGEPILVTGGARGITAAIVAELARRWRPTLLLLGTSPKPAEAEDPETASVQTPAKLKAVLHACLRREGRPVGPLDLERAYQSLRREREIRASLRRFRQAGARVEYAQADVRDPVALGATLADWEKRFGPPVGVIHGAGIIQDKLLCDKTPESFDRVLATKLDGALNLARLLRPQSLRFAAFFSSVAGRFGNRGQGDYAAANEALNKLALWLDQRWPCRVVSLVWGPWSGVGMVSDLEAHLGRRGFGMIAPEVGPALLLDELRFGRKGDVEVIIAGDLGPLADPAAAGTRKVAAIKV
jgi:acyl transferase domain-containing protein